MPRYNHQSDGHESAVVRGLIASLIPSFWRRGSVMRSNITISLDPSTSVRDVEKSLRRMGVEVDRVLDRIHVITGSVDHSRVDSVRRTPGVVGVEFAGEFHIDPI
jgi:hypothetical protein